MMSYTLIVELDKNMQELKEILKPLGDVHAPVKWSIEMGGIEYKSSSLGPCILQAEIDPNGTGNDGLSEELSRGTQMAILQWAFLSLAGKLEGMGVPVTGMLDLESGLDVEKTRVMVPRCTCGDKAKRKLFTNHCLECGKHIIATYPG